MGMFDYFHLEEGNQFKLLPGEYQTKDLDCALHTFTIDENNIIHGELGAKGYGDEELNLINSCAFIREGNDVPNDWLNIYGPCFGPDELCSEYFLRVVNSKVVEIKNYDDLYYNIETGVVLGHEWGGNVRKLRESLSLDTAETAMDSGEDLSKDYEIRDYEFPDGMVAEVDNLPDFISDVKNTEEE